jgi:hypothetical protein
MPTPMQGAGGPNRQDPNMGPSPGQLGHHPPHIPFMQMPQQGMQQQLQQQKPQQNYQGPGAGGLLRNVNQPGPPGGGGMPMQMQPQQPQNPPRNPFGPPNPQMMQQGSFPMPQMVMPQFPGYPFPGMPVQQYNQGPQFRPAPQIMSNQGMGNLGNLQQIPPSMGGGPGMGMGPADRMGPPPNIPFQEASAPRQREKKKLFEYDKATKVLVVDRKATDKEEALGDETVPDHPPSEAAHASAPPAPVVASAPVNGSEAARPAAQVKVEPSIPLDTGKGPVPGRGGQQVAGPQTSAGSVPATVAASVPVHEEKERTNPPSAPAVVAEKPTVAAEKPAAPVTKPVALAEPKEKVLEKSAPVTRQVIEEKSTGLRAADDESNKSILKGTPDPTAGVSADSGAPVIRPERTPDAGAESKELARAAEVPAEEKGKPIVHSSAETTEGIKLQEERRKVAPTSAAPENDDGETSLRPAQREAARPEREAAPSSSTGNKRIYEIEFLIKFQKICTKEPAGLSLKSSPELCRLTGINVPDNAGGVSPSANPGTPRGSQMNSGQQGGQAARTQQRNNNQTGRGGGGSMGGGRGGYGNKMGPPIELPRKSENAYDTSKTKPQNHTDRIMKVRELCVRDVYYFFTT